MMGFEYSATAIHILCYVMLVPRNMISGSVDHVSVQLHVMEREHLPFLQICVLDHVIYVRWITSSPKYKCSGVCETVTACAQISVHVFSYIQAGNE